MIGAASFNLNSEVCGGKYAELTEYTDIHQ
jgi:hypothetical protein